MMCAARRSKRLRSGALVIIASTCAVAALYVSKPVIVPVLVAIVMALCLAPAVDGLVRVRVPRAVAAGLVLAGTLLALSALLNATWTPARTWLDSAPQTMATIETKVRPIQLLIGKLDQIGQSARHLAGAYQAHTPVAVNGEAVQVALSTEAMTIVPEVIATAALIVALVFLLLAFGPEWISRLSLSHSIGVARSGVVLTRAIRQELSRYPASIALINVGVGLAVALLARVCGPPNPMLWGTLAALLAMWLLWALWGVAGVALAVPLLLTLKVLAANVEALRSLHPLIGALPPRGRVAAATRPLRPASGGKLSLVP